MNLEQQKKKNWNPTRIHEVPDYQPHVTEHTSKSTNGDTSDPSLAGSKSGSSPIFKTVIDTMRDCHR